MKKKLIALVLAVTVLVGAIVGGTLAYLSDVDSAVNVATVGNVKIKQTEMQRENGELVPFVQGQKLYPAYPSTNSAYEIGADGFWGAELVGTMDKIVFVENTGRSELYFRTWIAFECPTNVEFGTDIIANLDTDNYTWTEDVTYAEIGGTRYAVICGTYTANDGVLESKTTADASLRQVVMHHGVNNAKAEACGDTYEILVFSQAVQIENMPSAEAALVAAFGTELPWAANYKAVYNAVVSNDEEFKAAMSSGAAVINVKLTADVSIDTGANNILGGEKTENIVIEANGHNVNFNLTNADWSHVSAVNPDAILTIRDAHITSSGYNTGHWTRTVLAFNCKVIFENITAANGIGFGNDAVVNDSVISQVGDNYAVWIGAKGQNVTLYDVTVMNESMQSTLSLNDAATAPTGRGIKISDENISEPKKITLSISDGTFMTGKKAAVVVSSKVGADIQLSNVDISGCVADSISAVWVDEDYASSANNVNVNGGYVIVEGSILNTVTTAEELKLAILYGADNIVLADDITVSEYVKIPKELVTTIDLNGYKLSGADETATYVINNHGTLTLKDSVGTGSVNARGIYNGYDEGGNNVSDAKLTVLNGTYNAKGTNGGAAIFNCGIVTIKDGTFTSVGGYSLNNRVGGVMTVENGNVTGGIYNEGALTINGGDIATTRGGYTHAIYNIGTELIVNGGNFSGNGNEVINSNASVATINGGTFKKVEKTSYLLAGSAMVINGGTFLAYCENGVNPAAHPVRPDVTVKGGTFNYRHTNIADGFKIVEAGNVYLVLSNEIANNVISTEADLKAAIEAGKTEINIVGNIKLTQGITASNVTFVGVGDNAGINFDGNNITGSGSITYKNLNLITKSLPQEGNGERYGWYGGIDYQNHSIANYENCTIAGVFTTYSTTVNVNGCTFNPYIQDGEEFYHIFVYGSTTVNVSDSTFYYGDRSIKIYNEGGSQNIEFNISDCDFKAAEGATVNKALINVDTTFMTSVKLNIENITVDAALSGVKTHNCANNAKVTVTIK